MTLPAPDGPDTELAAIVADLDDLHTEAASVAMRSEGSVTAAAEEVRDDVASIRDRLRAVLARPAAGRDLTGDDVRTAFETWEKSGDGFGEHAGPYVAGLLNSIARPAGPRVGADAAAELEPVLRAEGLTASADAMRARSAVARTDGQPPADPVQITRDPARVTAQVVQAVWDEEGPEGVADWIRDMTAAPADDTAAATAPWMVESRDELVDRLTRHVENVADCAGIEIEVREAGPLTGPAPLRRLVRALEGAGMLHDDPADDTAAPDQRHPQTVGSLAHAEAMFFRDHARRGYALLRGMARRSSELRRAGQPVRGSQTEAES